MSVWRRSTSSTRSTAPNGRSSWSAAAPVGAAGDVEVAEGVAAAEAAEAAAVEAAEVAEAAVPIGGVVLACRAEATLRRRTRFTGARLEAHPILQRTRGQAKTAS